MHRLLLFCRTPIADYWLREAKTCKTHLLTFSSDEASRDRFFAVSVSPRARPCVNVLGLMVLRSCGLSLVFFELLTRPDIFSYIFVT